MAMRIVGVLLMLVLLYTRLCAQGYTFNGCSAYQFKAVDPIVFPGRPTTPHLHTFFGSNRLNFNTTRSSSLFSGCTSCQNAIDKSSYWTPTVFNVSKNGKYFPLKPAFRAYYDSIGPTTRPFPKDFKMVAGNSRATSAADPGTVASRVNWYCTAGDSTKPGETKLIGDFPTVACPGLLAINIFFPSCYTVAADGSYVTAYKISGKCPPHYFEIPQLWFSMRYNVAGYKWGKDGTAPLYLSSGEAYTFHADFFNGWHSTDVIEMTKHQDKDGEFHIGPNGSPDQPNDPPCTPKDPYDNLKDYTQFIIGHHEWDTSR